MKKYTLLFVFFLIFFTACALEKGTDLQLRSHEDLNDNQNDKTDNPPLKIDINQIKSQLEVRSITLLSEGGFSEYKLIYPFIVGLDSNDMTNINKMLYEAVIPKSYASNDYLEFFKFSSLFENIEISYEITYMNDDLISVLYSGDLVRGGSYTDYDKAITIDMKRGKALSLKDFYEISELQKIISELIETDKSRISDGLSDNYNDPEIKETMKSILLNDFSSEIDLERTDNFYLKEGKICLIASPFPSTRQNTLAEFDIGKKPCIKYVEE